MLKNTHKCICLVCVSKRLLLKLNITISLFLDFFMVLLQFRKHTDLHGKINTLLIIVKEDRKLRMMLLPTAKALHTATFIKNQM